MAKVTNFTPDNLNLIRAAIDAQLAEVEKSFGIKIDIGKMTYVADSFKCQMSAVVGSKVDNPYLVDVPAELINNLTKYRDYKDALGKEITEGTKKWVVVGLRGKNYIVKKFGQPSGGMFKMPIQFGNEVDCQVRGIDYKVENDSTKRPQFSFK